MRPRQANPPRSRRPERVVDCCAHRQRRDPRVEPLVDAYPFKSYRHYRVLSRKQQHAVMLAEVEQTLVHPSGIVLETRDGDRVAVAVARVLDWDSGFFGVPMGRIEYLLASDSEMLRAALDRALDALAARGVRHVSARVDVADIGGMAVLESAGFRLMDALVTYTTRPRKEPPRDIRQVGTIRDSATATPPNC